MSRQKELQAAIHQYKRETGETEVNMVAVARHMVERWGVELRPPADPYERLAHELSRAARQETRKDPHTGRPYRVHHMYPVKQGDKQLHLWLDIDENVPREKMRKCLTLRREQMIGDAYHLQVDAEHWNSIHPDAEPIQLVLDFTDDVEERKAMDDEDADEGAA